MKPPPKPPLPVPLMSGACANMVLAVAAELERDEAAVKHAILAAASAGDCGAVIDIVTKWLDWPAAQALAEARVSSPRKRGRA